MSLPEDVKFEVVRENWNSYDVGHNLILKTKVVLVKIIKPPNVSIQDVRQLGFVTPVLTAVYSPLERKGTPETRTLTPDLINESIVEDLDPKLLGTEQINEYEMKTGGFIRLRVILNRVALTDLYTNDGSPVIAISHQVVPQIILPRPTRRQRSKRSRAV